MVVVADETVQTFRTALTVPGHQDALRLIRPYIQELGEMIALPGPHLEEVGRAVEEAYLVILQRAFDPDNPGTVTVRSTVDPHRWELGLQEHGLPLDESVETAIPSVAPAAAAWQHVHGAFDEVHWSNLGKDGSELRLVLERPQRDVTQQLSAEDLTPVHEDTPLAPEQPYEIRRMRPDEAIQVAQCVYRAYGYSYPNEDLYYPERIVHLNSTGELISVVAATEGGEVVGHLGLERTGLGPVAESGQAVVMPAHRGRHLLERMRQQLEEEGRLLGLIHVWSQPVTSHTFSQRMNEQLGSRVCGVTLGAIPASVSFKKIKEESGAQRESCMFYVKFLGPPQTSVVYAPPQHREMLARIYDHLGVEAEVREPAMRGGPSRVSVSLDRTWGNGMIRVEGVGTRTVIEVRQALEDLAKTSGADVIYLDLPLAQPGTPQMCMEFEEDGFFFSGVAPSFAPDGDVLRMQYLNVPLDPAQLQVYSPFAREIVDYAVADRARVQAL